MQDVKEEIAKRMDDAWGLMGENADEAARFFETLDDETRALSVRFSDAVADEWGSTDDVNTSESHACSTYSSNILVLALTRYPELRILFPYFVR